jgi:hypothetical protein
VPYCPQAKAIFLTSAIPLLIGTVTILCISWIPEVSIAKELESIKGIIAAQIRSQGYSCDQPKTAKRDKRASKPDEDVWVLQCEGASYRVRLDPDMAAKVERLGR